MVIVEQAEAVAKQNDFYLLNKQLVANDGAFDQRVVSVLFFFFRLILRFACSLETHR
jgi:hypothetical protein